ncbi:MAG: TrmH family RNA methyltransferase [Huintestinicola sp.]
MKEITSRDNEKIKLYRKLSDDKKFRRREKKFPLEGIRLVTDAAAEAVKLHCIFVSETALKKYGEALELLLKNYENVTYLIPDSLAGQLADTQMTQGLFAIGEIPALDKSEYSAKIVKGGRYLVLDYIQDPGNMGTMLRTADACGINAVIVCGCCDIYSPKVTRSAMGSVFRVDIIETDIETAAQMLRNAGIPMFAAVIDSDAVSLRSCDFSRGGAVMIGNEGNGLPPEHAALCDTRMTIKMHGTVNSLNAAMAAGIIMWELSQGQFS